MHDVIGSFEIGVMIDENSRFTPPPSPAKKTSLLDCLIGIFANFSLNY
ncbi:hypothetical protein [Metapseudomonas resinovorans]|nr:hypothetical protein [Pseudomonas resinovorans]